MYRHLLFAIITLCAALSTAAQRVYVLPIDNEIDATAWRYTSRAIAEVNESEQPYDLLLVRLNTYGGAVDMADSIRSALMNAAVPTAVFIDHNAASAGALIALACDSAFMSPGASIGAATVVGADGQPMPPKYQSYWSSVMRATAMSHGRYIPEGDSVARWRRDPDLAALMVNPDTAMAFTAEEALRRHLIDGIAANTSQVLEQLNMPNAQITTFESNTSDDILGFLASAGVRAILIMLIVGGIYMEMHTPGMGFAAAVATVAAILYFMPMVITGTLAPWVIIVFIIGIVALALEIFVIPGFGVAGIGGIIAIAVSLLGAIVSPEAIDGGFGSSIVTASIVFLVGILLAVGAVLLLTSKYGPKCFRAGSVLTLQKSIDQEYVGVDTSLAQMVGREAVAITDLRPAGKIEIDGQRLDATSTGEFITAGSKVVVVRFEAASLYVKLA